MTMQKSKPGSSRSDQNPVLPQVRYHPSIQNPGGAAGPKTTNKTRTSQAQKAKPARRPQTGTSRTPVQEDKGAGSAGGPRDHMTQTGTEEPAATGTDLPEPAPTDAPRPEEVPLGVGLQLDQHVVEKVEVLTRGQRTNPNWFAWRRNRITASIAHCIARSRFVNGQSRTPPASYLSAVTGEASRVQTRAMSWGVEMEATAVRKYQDLKCAALGRQVSVQECGLFIDSQRPWLAASPDGIVTDRQTGQWLLCLEVKCPFKHRQKRVEDACRDDPAFCLQIQDEDRREPGQPPVYRLKTSHSYFTQIQCQLAVTGLKRADLVVFTLKETAVVPVTFDPELWEETVSKLEVFYRDAVLPSIRQRTPQDAAAWTPEV